MPESEEKRKLLLYCAGASVRDAARAAVAGRAELVEATDAATAQRRVAEGADVVILDGKAAETAPAALLAEDGPPVIVVGTAPAESAPFAVVSSPVELASLIAPALRYRALQLETNLIREESERIHGEMLQSYGDLSEHRQRLEAEVRQQTIELRRYADELEQQVDERTKALQQSNSQLVQQEKMAALGALVAGIAHDMHTPIGSITSNSDVLNRSLVKLNDLLAGEGCPDSFRSSPELKRILKIVDEIARVNQLACDRIVGIVRSLRNYARLDEADIKAASLHDGLDSTLTLIHHELKNRITVKKEYGDIPLVQCHPNQLNQVFMNILVNASHAMPQKGTITIRTSREGDHVKVQISDTGTGIKPENLAKIFEPGFTTKGVGVGTGLGLAICYRIIQDHKGQIDVESEVGRGTTFTISLPLEWKAS